MTYEEYLDEIATLLTEIYKLKEDTAIGIVMRAQDDEYFSPHDDDPTMCTQERAEQDARVIFKRYKTVKKSKGNGAKT